MDKKIVFFRLLVIFAVFNYGWSGVFEETFRLNALWTKTQIFYNYSLKSANGATFLLNFTTADVTNSNNFTQITEEIYFYWKNGSKLNLLREDRLVQVDRYLESSVGEYLLRKTSKITFDDLDQMSCTKELTPDSANPVLETYTCPGILDYNQGSSNLIRYNFKPQFLISLEVKTLPIVANVEFCEMCEQDKVNFINTSAISKFCQDELCVPISSSTATNITQNNINFLIPIYTDPGFVPEIHSVYAKYPLYSLELTTYSTMKVFNESIVQLAVVFPQELNRLLNNEFDLLVIIKFIAKKTTLRLLQTDVATQTKDRISSAVFKNLILSPTIKSPELRLEKNDDATKWVLIGVLSGLFILITVIVISFFMWKQRHRDSLDMLETGNTIPPDQIPADQRKISNSNVNELDCLKKKKLFFIIDQNSDNTKFEENSHDGDINSSSEDFKQNAQNINAGHNFVAGKHKFLEDSQRKGPIDTERQNSDKNLLETVLIYDETLNNHKKGEKAPQGPKFDTKNYISGKHLIDSQANIGEINESEI